MKKILIAIFTATIAFSVNAQNTFPTNGNVGIGTTTPSQQLTVSGNLNIESPTGGKYIGYGIPGVNEYNTIGSLYSSAVLTLSHGLKPHGSQGIMVYSHPEMARSAITVGGFGETGIKFYTKGVSVESIGAAFNDAPRMTILNNGFVGIGTTDPEAKLHVVGNVKLSGNYDGSNNVQFATAGGAGNIWELYPQINGFGVFNRNSSSWPLFITNDNNVGIGNYVPVGSEKLGVNGKIRAHEIKVEIANWPDYVFAKDYTLPSLAETERHIQEKGHLIGIPSAADVKANGIDLGEMNGKLLQKIEELTLHLIEQNKLIETYSKQIISQNQRIIKLEVANTKSN